MWVIVRSLDRGYYKTPAFKLSHYLFLIYLDIKLQSIYKRNLFTILVFFVSKINL